MLAFISAKTRGLVAGLGLALAMSWLLACSPSKPVTNGLEVKPPGSSSSGTTLSPSDLTDRMRALNAILKEIPDHEPSLEARIKLRLEYSHETWLAVHDAMRYASLQPSSADRQMLLAEACGNDTLIGPAVEALSKALKVLAAEIPLNRERMADALRSRSEYRLLLGNPSGALSDLQLSKQYRSEEMRGEHIAWLEVLAGKAADLRTDEELTVVGSNDIGDFQATNSWLYAMGLTKQSLLREHQVRVQGQSFTKAEELRKQANDAFITAVNQGLFTPEIPRVFRVSSVSAPSPTDLQELRLCYHLARVRLHTLHTYRLGMRPSLLHDPATLTERANRSTHWIKLGENNWMYINTGGPDLSQIATLLAWVGVADGSEGGVEPGEPGPKGVLIRDTLPENDSSILYWIGARRGDVVASVNQEAVSSLFEAAAVVTKHIAANPNQPLHRFEAAAYRNGQPFPVTITTFDPDVPTPVDTPTHSPASKDLGGR